MYDLFYVSRTNIQEEDWNLFRNRFPLAQKLENVRSFNDIKQKSFTKLFWVVWNDLEIADGFKFDYKVPKWDLEYIHVFKNGNHYDGVTLFPKSASISKKEFEHRFYANKKEIDILASTPKIYDIFDIDNYQEYIDALEKSSTDMFWMKSRNIKPHPEFKFDFYISHHEVEYRNQNHAFIHRTETADTFDGIFLCSKNQPLTKKEIEFRFPIRRTEWNIVASMPREYGKYPYTIDTYDDYLEAFENTATTEMFWMIPSDVQVEKEFNFNLYFTKDNLFDRKINHVFLNGDNYDGIMLLSKHKKISKKEFDHRFLVDKKEWKIIASKPKKFDIFYIDEFEEYQTALENSSTDMFWMTSRNLQVAEDFNFDFYISHHNTVHRSMNHAFIHRVGDNDTYNGIFLCSKNKPLTKKEIEHRFPIERKEWDIVASGPVKYTRYVVN
jgi:CYTH domain-containing protein